MTAAITADAFGTVLAARDLTNAAGDELVVGDPFASAGGVSDAGAVALLRESAVEVTSGTKSARILEPQALVRPAR